MGHDFEPVPIRLRMWLFENGFQYRETLRRHGQAVSAGEV